MVRTRLLPLLSAAVLLVACGSDQGTSPSSNNTFDRVYVLTWVNGIALPHTYAIDDVGFTLIGDRITFKKDGQFIESMTVTLTQAEETTDPVVAEISAGYTYSPSTGAISLNMAPGGQLTALTGHITDASMTLTEGNDTFVFLPEP